MPNPIRYAELRTAKEWHIPISEWDGLPMDAKMEMMAHLDVEDKIESYVRWQRDNYRRIKYQKKNKLTLKEGRRD